MVMEGYLILFRKLAVRRFAAAFVILLQQTKSGGKAPHSKGAVPRAVLHRLRASS